MAMTSQRPDISQGYHVGMAAAEQDQSLTHKPFLTPFASGSSKTISADLLQEPAKLNQMGLFLIHELLQKYLALFIRLPVCSPLIKIQGLGFDRHDQIQNPRHGILNRLYPV